MKRFVGMLLRLLMRLPGANQALETYLINHAGPAFRGADDTRLRNPTPRNDFAWLHAFVAREEGAPLSALLGGGDEELLVRALKEDRVAANLAQAAAADEGQGLKNILNKYSSETLTRLLSKDQGLFDRVARSGDSALLKELLFRDDYHVLRELLSIRSYEALRAAVLDSAPEVFRMVAIAREGGPLAEVLFANDSKVLCDLLSKASDDQLRPIVESLNTQLLSSSHRELYLRACPPTPSLAAAADDADRWPAASAMATAWRDLAPHVHVDHDTMASLENGLGEIRNPAHVPGRILEAITRDDQVKLVRGTLRFPCRHSLWTLLHEVLVHEDYYFSCETPTPRIIDGGTHMGMALYYFKTLYPAARITGFEPLPRLRELAEENVALNNLGDIEILPYALSGASGEATFYASTTWSMAGSLHDRRRAMGDEVEAVTVSCVPLSDYLDEPVHFLKLDIEGSELEVLREGASKLCQVHHLFCEVHLGGPLGSNRLSEILQLLETAQFDVHVGKSHNFQQASSARPFTHFDGAASMLVWARNRHWPPAAP